MKSFWVVGDEAILKSEVEEAQMSAQYEGRRFDGDPYCVIPEEIAVQKLFLHQAALDSIEVAESEVIQRVDYMTNVYIANIGSREKMEEYFNKTSSQIRETLRDNAREGLKVQKMQQKLVGDIKITPAEVRRYFKDLPQDSIPYIPTQVEVQIITQQPKIPLEEIEDVKRRLREYTDRVNNGESFSMLARLYSDDRGTAINGGEMPFTGRGYLDPAFANVAFNLQDPNKVSKIVESEYGFHIIQLMEKRGDRIKVRHILLKPHVPEEALMAYHSGLIQLQTKIHVRVSKEIDGVTYSKTLKNTTIGRIIFNTAIPQDLHFVPRNTPEEMLDLEINETVDKKVLSRTLTLALSIRAQPRLLRYLTRSRRRVTNIRLSALSQPAYSICTCLLSRKRS